MELTTLMLMIGLIPSFGVCTLILVLVIAKLHDSLEEHIRIGVQNRISSSDTTARIRSAIIDYMKDNRDDMINTLKEDTSESSLDSILMESSLLE